METERARAKRTKNLTPFDFLQMYDKDGSGTIEMDEMVEVLETVYVMEGVMSNDNTTMAKNRARAIFGQLGKN